MTTTRMQNTYLLFTWVHIFSLNFLPFFVRAFGRLFGAWFYISSSTFVQMLSEGLFYIVFILGNDKH